MSQLSFLVDIRLTSDELRKKSDVCPYCHRKIRAYCKSLDKRLVGLAYDALTYCLDNRKTFFRLKDVFPDHDYRKVNDFQKLSYWKIFERPQKGEGWKITQIGYQFLVGDLELPKQAWVFNKQVVSWGGEKVSSETAKERWQQFRADYVLDFVPMRYLEQIKNYDSIFN